MFLVCVLAGFVNSFSSDLHSPSFLHQEHREGYRTSKMPPFRLMPFRKVASSCLQKHWQLCEAKSNSCIQTRSEPYQFGQAWRKRAHNTHPAVEQLLLDKVAPGQPHSYCSGADEAPWLQATYYVKPQCSNMLDLSPLEISKHTSSQGWLCPLMHNREGGSASLCSVEPSAHLPLVEKVRDIQDNWKTPLFCQVYFHQHKEDIII